MLHRTAKEGQQRLAKGCKSSRTPITTNSLPSLALSFTATLQLATFTHCIALTSWLGYSPAMSLADTVLREVILVRGCGR